MQKNGKKVRIFSALEVANICGVVNQTAVNWIKNGHLKAFVTPGKQYRVYSDDLVEFLEARGMRVPGELLEEVQPKKVISKEIVIVDDDKDVNNVITRFLNEKLKDYTILQAFDGYEAGKIIAAHKPAAIVLDLRLPGIDGKKLCGQIKSDSDLGDPKIIAITGMNDDQSRTEMLEQGADAFFQKPLDFNEFFNELDHLLKEYAGVV